MAKLAQGDTSADIAGRRAATKQASWRGRFWVFRDQMMAEQRLAADQDAQRVQAERDKYGAAVKLKEWVSLEVRTSTAAVDVDASA